MNRLPKGIFVAALAVASHGDAQADHIVNAAYVEPVTRYGHYAVGRPHEYDGIRATTHDGRALTLQLGDSQVFEDVTPRIVTLSSGGPPVLLVIISDVARGSQLALVEIVGGALTIGARSEPVGRPQRWLNPVGVADLDGDGVAEIAAVVTPHIGGTLKVYQRQGEKLVEAAALAGFSNHIYGTTEQALSTPLLVDNLTRLLVPDADRRQLLVVGLASRSLVVTQRCGLPEPVVGPVLPNARGGASAVLQSGRRFAFPAECTN